MGGRRVQIMLHWWIGTARRCVARAGILAAPFRSVSGEEAGPALHRWADKLCEQRDPWQSRDSGQSNPMRAEEYHGLPDVPEAWSPVTTQVEGWPFVLGTPELLRYFEGGWSITHKDPSRLTLLDIIQQKRTHIGTLAVVRYSHDADGGDLRYVPDNLMIKLGHAMSSRVTTLTSPVFGLDWQEAYLPRGVKHHVSRVRAGHMITLRFPVFVRSSSLPVSGGPFAENKNYLPERGRRLLRADVAAHYSEIFGKDAQRAWDQAFAR